MEAISAGTGSAIVVGESTRRYWKRRETRLQAAFRAAVEMIVDESMAEVVRRQERVMLHLDLQDRRLERIERKLNQH